MRMTNKIMRNNSAYNINQNKILQDKLTNQMTNQSKIVRPSDDPVVAIRALRLRSNVTAVTQYNEKNAEDAKQWLSLTADAMDTVDSVMNKLYEQCTAAPNKFKTSDDLRIHLSQMKQLTAEFYSCANVDYAGRYVFSGYRTDLPVTFTEEDIRKMGEYPVSYNISESFGFEGISRISYTNYEKLEQNLTGAGNPSYPAGVNQTNSYQQNVKNDTLYRFRLSYDNVDLLSAGSSITITMPKMPANEHIKVTSVGGTIQTDIVDDTGAVVTGSTTTAPQFAEFTDQEAAYKAIANGTGTPPIDIAFIPSTGELVFSKKFCDANFSEADFQNGNAFHVNYNKSSWKTDDINPVHYFECVETKTISAPGVKPPQTRVTAYNTQRDKGRDQDIYYDVGYNQQIQVNTRADEIFTHNVRRDMDDFDHYLKEFVDIEKLQKDLEEKLNDWPTDSKEYKDLEERLEGVEKAKTYIQEEIHTKFENQITKYQKYMDDSRVAMTDSATRGSRLELIKTRLVNQQATFKELQQDNEGIDITEVAVELTSSELTYNAALMATGKIMQTNLMNYI